MPRGCWTRSNIKSRTDDVISISITQMSLKPGGHIIIYPNKKQVTYSVSGNKISLIPSGQVVFIDTSGCNFGGSRRWLLCPKCQRRTLKLYETNGAFYCRTCQGLPYSSQRESETDRLMRKVRKLRNQLGASSDLAARITSKPKGMHWKTYHRLRHQEAKANLQFILELTKGLPTRTTS